MISESPNKDSVSSNKSRSLKSRTAQKGKKSASKKIDSGNESMIDKMSKYNIETSSTTSSSVIFSNLTSSNGTKTNASRELMANSKDLVFLKGAFLYSNQHSKLQGAKAKLRKSPVSKEPAEDARAQQ